AEVLPRVRFVCLKRQRDVTVASWVNHLKSNGWPNPWLPSRESQLPWADSLPDLGRDDPEEAAGRWWDLYYEIADTLTCTWPGRFLILPPETLATQAGRRRILDFLGVE
ncbi:MAG: hypothetical protein V2B18_20900, partial [Pseudomonadota bacterium]